MAFKLSCGLIILLLATVTRSGPTDLAPIGVFRTAHAEMERGDLYKYQGTVDDWYGTIGSIVQGGGSLIKRSREGEAKMQAARDVATGPVASGAYVKKMLGWQDDSLIRTGNFWEEKIYQDRNMLQIIPNEHPYGLPEGVEHWMLWTRESPLTPDLFKPLPHEEVPNQDFLNSARVEALIRYINHYDFYGTSGISDEVLKDFVPSKFFHPTEDKVWVDPLSTEKVTRKEGVEAMSWAGRHVLKVIHTKFSPMEYEILFDRPPERWKSVVSPDHFHVLVKRKPTEIRTALKTTKPKRVRPSPYTRSTTTQKGSLESKL
ncbi:hypothetical protein MJO28_010779 [Puccinia striiformis f. sp. tritici]|uniref:Secreted protein n=5 Tax=Puccinia striiformis TaxID=27350 RepID=A0A0L0W1L2_9BASI|nr:hypothetical protein MJO28_010779 [Puccinia striiformis f. sp. tritici]KAI7948861.1 hypothetical protein MJO29_010526 [Puccinia striiformis f. sp. tritici]KNF05362.1 hypothetical protein PSTG_01577 [Puccinia striiformis f. sp. tritici PST-78]POW08857.1 hypothetical protein PSHT_09387 [Puccinia striiformis]POW13663.1 hypothetical protein PSTT_03569 [Puccinia striiformis]